jgi:hypothetical protein
MTGMIRTFVATTALICAAFVGVPAASAVPLSAGPHIDRPLSPVSLQNAVEKAQEYLDMTSFSKSGLIEQLEYEGFSAADATAAVNSLTVDWNRQAALKAKEYLGMTSFSASGLAEQLEFEGFTASQAAYGVAVAYR